MEEYFHFYIFDLPFKNSLSLKDLRFLNLQAHEHYPEPLHINSLHGHQFVSNGINKYFVRILKIMLTCDIATVVIVFFRCGLNHYL